MSVPVKAPLAGELLGKADVVTVACALHPFRAARDVWTVPAGLSLAEIVEAAGAGPGHLRGRILVSLGGHVVPRALWGRVRPKAGVTLVLRAVPAGGAGGLFRSIALLAVAVLTAFVAPYLTPIIGAFGAAVVSAAITVGAGLLISALFPVNARGRNGDPVYSIAGNQNLAARYQAIPCVLGQMRVYPRYGASAATEFEGEDQVLRVLFVWGYGPLDVTDIKIGETPIGEFHDVEIQTYRGYPTDPAPTLYPSQVVQQDLNIEVKGRDGWTTRTTSDEATEWALDFIAPNGLSETKKSGETKTVTVLIEIQQSVAYSEDWQPVETLQLSANSTRPIRRTVRRPVASGAYDIRWRRVSPDHDGNARVSSSVGATALRSYRAAPPISFGKPLAVTALRIRATSQLSGVIDNLNGVVTSRVRAFDGSAWVDDVPSRNPADLIVRTLQGPANARPLAASRIDWIGLQAFRAWCVAKAYAYDRVHEERQSVLDAAQDIASAGRGAIVFRDGLWSVVWEDVDHDLVVQHFTTRNAADFRANRNYRRLPHALRARFKNRRRGWRDDEIVIYADGYSAATATLFETVEFPGQTDHELVWRHGRYHLAQLRLRPEECSLTVDVEHLVCTRGDRVRVTYDVPGWGIVSARVVGVEGGRVYLDEPVSMAAGRSYCLRIRQETGASFVRGVVTQVGETDVLALSGSGPLPAAGDLAMVGEVDQETVVLRVKAIIPGDDLSAELILVDDAPEIAQADQGDVPPPTGGGPGGGPELRTPINLRVLEGIASPAQGYAPTVTFLWDTPAGGPPIDRFDVALKGPSDSAFGPSVTVAATLRARTWLSLPAGSTGFRVRSLFTEGAPSNWASVTVDVVAGSATPPDVVGLRAAVIAGQIIFSWDQPQAAVRLDLRYSPATAGATWESATARASRDDGTTLTIPFAAGTYLAKFARGGLASANAVALVITAAALPSSTVAGEIFDMSPFGGTHTRTVEADGGVRLFLGPDGVFPRSGFYQPAETIALAGIYVGRISGEVLAHGIDRASGAADLVGVDPLAWGVVLEMRSTRDDPAAAGATWTEWAALAEGEVVGRGFQVRVQLTSEEDTVSPVVELIHLRLDLEARVEALAAVAVPAAGKTIGFAPAFAADPAVVVSGRDFAAGDRATFGARSADGLTLTIRDAGGAAVARTVDIIASGYGHRLS